MGLTSGLAGLGSQPPRGEGGKEQLFSRPEVLLGWDRGHGSLGDTARLCLQSQHSGDPCRVLLKSCLKKSNKMAEL